MSTPRSQGIPPMQFQSMLDGAPLTLNSIRGPPQNGQPLVAVASNQVQQQQHRSSDAMSAPCDQGIPPMRFVSMLDPNNCTINVMNATPTKNDTLVASNQVQQHQQQAVVGDADTEDE